MTISNNHIDNLPIAFFDSGVGGLTVLHHLKKLLPDENYLYFGDTLHVPYGEKTKNQLIEYSDNILNFFNSLGCKAVVMACNTTSSVIYDDIKGKYDFKLYPIVQTVSKVLSKLKISNLGVFATKATIESKAYEREIAKYNPNIKVFGQYCPNWVKIVENNTLNLPENIEIVKKDLELMLKNNPENIVLGCTHYPFLKGILSKFAPEDLFIDPAVYFAELIVSDLKKNALLKNSNSDGDVKFFVSSNPQKFKDSAKLFYDIKELPQLVTF